MAYFNDTAFLSPNIYGEISTANQLVKYIRLMLGEPVIQVELTDEHIHQIIRDTVKTYTDVVYGFFETAELVEVDLRRPETYSFRFIDWDEVTQVTYQNGKTCIPFKWDSIKRTCKILGDINQSILIIKGQARYRVDEEFDLIFNESWVKDFAKAKSQLLWGQIVGKYSQSLVGGATINYDRLISEAQADIEKLMEELQEKWVDPAPVLVG